MPNFFVWIGFLVAGYKKLVEYLQENPVVWAATLDGQPVELLRVGCTLEKPQSHYRVNWKGADGIEHLLEADHDFDGKPPDTLWLDDVLIDGGDMDIMLSVSLWRIDKSEARLQWEWTDPAGAHRLRLATNLREGPLAQRIEEMLY